MTPTRQQVEECAKWLYNTVVPQFEDHPWWTGRPDEPKALDWTKAAESARIVWHAIARAFLTHGGKMPKGKK